GAQVWNTCQRKSLGVRCAAKILPIWRYWPPVVTWMLSQPGAFGSAGGLAASRPAWQPAHDTPNRYGELLRPGGCVGLKNGVGRLRMPTTPADETGPWASTSHGQTSRPPVARLPGVQSGSLTAPQALKRWERGVVSRASKPRWKPITCGPTRVKN